MKKFKFFAVMLMVCFFLAGCSLNDNLKLCKINMSISTFYHNAMLKMSDIYEYGKVNVDSSLKNSYETYLNIFDSMNLPSYTLVSAMDFCIEIVEDKSEQIQKIYEYSYGNENVLVIANKVNNNGKFWVEVYLGLSDVSDTINVQPYVSATYEISKQKNSGYNYTAKINEDEFVGEFLFNNDLGKMQFTIKYKEASGAEFSASLFNYRGNVLGGRFYITEESSNQSTKMVREFLSKDFYKQAKIGIVEDQDLYVDMENTRAELIGATNSGDKTGFTIIYDNSKTDQKILVSAY